MSLQVPGLCRINEWKMSIFSSAMTSYAFCKGVYLENQIKCGHRQTFHSRVI